MRSDPEKCIGCGKCAVYCPLDCIDYPSRPAGSGGQGKLMAVVDEDECVECGCCLRAQVCPTEALYRPELTWPRNVRAAFSDPTITFEETNVSGRGTEEMKTNDVTGRFQPGMVGFATEMGRPGVGARLRDLDTMARALAKVGARFEPLNPVTSLVMEDPATGRVKADLLEEKVLSAIIEAEIELDRFPAVLEVIKEVAGELESVFSLDVICPTEGEGPNPALPIIARAGFEVRINGKTNLGLGRRSNQEVGS